MVVAGGVSLCCWGGFIVMGNMLESGVLCGKKAIKRTTDIIDIEMYLKIFGLDVALFIF